MCVAPRATSAPGWPADVEPAGVPVVGRTGEWAVDASVPVDDGAEREAEAERGAPPACLGNERAGGLPGVDPAEVLRVGLSGEEAANGSFSVGDGAAETKSEDPGWIVRLVIPTEGIQ